MGSSITGVLLVGALAVPAMAAHDTTPSDEVATYSYDLDEVADNAPGEVDGNVRLKALPNGKIQVKVRASGLAPNLPHAQHLHGLAGDGSDAEGAFVPGECPTGANDGDDAGTLVDTLEGAAAYGGVQQSLTVSGDTDAAAALNLADFPVADDRGNLRYQRTFTPSDPAVWSELGDLEVVIHGIDLDQDGEYDFDSGPSSLSPEAPLEATIPVLCGGVNG